MTPADEKHVKLVRAKIAGYPRLAREAFRRGEHDKAAEHWRSWHEAIAELIKHIGAAPN